MKKVNNEKIQISAGMNQATLERLAHLFGICLYKLNLDTKDIGLTVNTTRLAGYNYNDLPQTDDSRDGMIYEDDRDLVSKSIHAIVSGQKDHYHIEYRMRRKDSSIVWIEEVGLISEYDKGGRPLYMSAMAADLSRLKWAEEKARQMESTVRKLSLGGDAGKKGKGSSLADENRLLRAGNAAAATIIGGFHQEYETVLHQSIQMLGESLQADYAGLWRNAERNGTLNCFLRVQWTKKAHSLDTENRNNFFKYNEILPAWKNRLKDNHSAMLNDSKFSKGFMDACGIDAASNTLFIPLYLHDDFWGFIGFARKDNPFLAYEAEVILGTAIIIACSVSRNETFGKINHDRDKAIADTLAKGEFLSRMSHELRTPLNAIIGMTTIALKEKDSKRVMEHIKKVETSSQLLLNIINDILDMSKIEAGKLDIVKEPFDFNAMVRNAENIVRIKMDEKKQHFTVKCDDELLNKAVSDEHRILQVIINLLSNAMKFTPENGEISLIATHRKAGKNKVKLHVEVNDSGIGLTEEQQTKVFHAFEQADGGITRKYGGTGLGLTICKKILNALGGDIWVKSKPSQGACFFFELEAELGEPLQAVQKVSDIFDGGDDTTPNWSAYTILMAEDVDINREIVEIMLEETGVKIVSAVNGQEAVNMFNAEPNRYHLILMDIQMPVMDGLAATRAIRAAEQPGKSVPIVAMTANAFKEDVEICLQVGMNWHIAKPIIPWQFFSVLRKFLK